MRKSESEQSHAQIIQIESYSISNLMPAQSTSVEKIEVSDVKVTKY